MKAKIELKGDELEDKMFRNVLYLADQMSKLKVKFSVSDKTKQRREKIYQKVRRASKSK